MSKLFRLMFPVLALIFIGATPTLAQDDDGNKVAVMPVFLSAEGAQLEQLSRLSKNLSEALISALTTQNMEPLPMDDGVLTLSETSAKAQAKNMGASYLLQTRVTKNGDHFNLVGQLLALYPKGLSSRRQTVTVENSTQFPQQIERMVQLTTDHLTSGGEPVISVDIIGNTMMTSPAILNSLRIQPGGTYNEAKATSDIKRIYALGYFDDVAIKTSDLPGGKAVHFLVKERGQVTNIVFRGNKKIDTEDLLKAAGIKPNDIPSERTVAESVDNIKHVYADKGYSNIQISTHMEKEGQDETLVYEVTEGGKIYIKDIKFDGNSFFSNRTLSGQIETSSYNFLISWLSGSGKLNQEKLSGDAQRLEAYYHNNGFLQAQVGDPIITNEKDDSSLIITFPIVEGERYKVGEITVVGQLLEDDDPKTLVNLTNLRSEPWFSREILQQDIKILQTYYSDKGYAHNTVEPKIEAPREGNILDVVFQIQPNNKVYFDRITIVGNNKTRDKVIRRQLTVVEGDLFSSSKIQTSQANLMRSTYFEQANLVPGPSDTDEKMNLRVEVKERPTGSFQVGGGYSNYNSIFGVVRLTQDNLFGYGRRAAVEANLGSKNTFYNFSFTDPWVFDIPLSAGFDLFRYENRYDYYTKKSNGTAARLGYPVWGNFYLSTRYSLEKINISNVPDTASSYLKSMSDYTADSQLILSLRRDTRNHFFFPTSGTVARLTYGKGSHLFGGQTDFSKYEAEAAIWIPAPFFKNASLMGHGQVGYLVEDRDKGLPIYEKYMIGGINSVRGYNWYSISPRENNLPTGATIGGEKMMVYNVELAFPLLREQGLYGVAFYDMGNVWEKDRNYSFSNLRSSIGGGLRYLSPMGPLRIEYGKPVGKNTEDTTSGQWEFTMGSMF